LWAQHFGSQLLAVDVQSPRVELAKDICGVRTATGDKYTPSQGNGTNKNLLDGVAFITSSTKGVQTELLPDGTLRATMDHLTSETYLPLGRVAAPVTGCGYILSFEARSTGTLNGRLGLGIDDNRGWDATHSGTNAEGVEVAREWTKFSVHFAALTDNTGAGLVWRFRPSKEGFTGTEEIRNVKVTTFIPARFPAYSALTASASRSSNGKTVYLIVFNRHHADDISADVNVKGIKNITGVRRWTVSGPSLAALNLTEEQVRETESGVTVPISPDGRIKNTFPARSMTAFEISCK
ncbi:MAG TPA: hypothetical protein VHV83_03070, partial [Armatimonadota bacterium]|nr:hypothetical protein [Armatimonadota bacterium]